VLIISAYSKALSKDLPAGRKIMTKFQAKIRLLGPPDEKQEFYNLYSTIRIIFVKIQGYKATIILISCTLKQIRLVLDKVETKDDCYAV
jgi:hypothetical protein